MSVGTALSILFNGNPSHRNSIMHASGNELEKMRLLGQYVTPIEQRPLLSPKTPDEYTDSMLACREEYVQRVRKRNEKMNNLWRFANLYAFFLRKARRTPRDPDAVDIVGDMPLSQRQRLQACHQLILLDQSRTTHLHPCDVPLNYYGRHYLASAVDLLKATIYARYRSYVGRRLDTLERPINSVCKALWHATTTELIKELELCQSVQGTLFAGMLLQRGFIPTTTTVDTVTKVLRLQPSTFDDMVRSLRYHRRDRYDDQLLPGQQGAVPSTHEIEDLIREGQYKKALGLMQRDFATLDTFKRFEKEDVDLIHLQALIAGFAHLFFGVNLSVGRVDFDSQEWRASDLVTAQRSILEMGDREFSAGIQWAVRARAQLLEDKFRRAWNVLASGQEETNKEVQKLIRDYLRISGVEYANVDEQGPRLASGQADRSADDGADGSER